MSFIAVFTCDFEAEDLCGFGVTSTTSYLKFLQHTGEMAADANLPATDNTGSPTANYLEADFRLNENGGGTDKVVSSSIFKNGFSGTEDQFVCMSFWYAHNVSTPSHNLNSYPDLFNCGPTFTHILL